MVALVCSGSKPIVPMNQGMRLMVRIDTLWVNGIKDYWWHIFLVVDDDMVGFSDAVQLHKGVNIEHEVS
jgi:hypothetical protein